MRETLSTKKWIVIVAAAGIAIIGVLLVYGIMVTPARQPYRDALTQYENTNNALARTSVSLNASTASDEDFAQGIVAVQAALTSLEKENEALGKEEVLTTGEGKTLYGTYDKDIARYIEYNSNVLTSMQKVRPVFHKCSTSMDGVEANAEGAAVMRVCAEEMRKATEVPDTDYKQLAESFHATYSELAAVFESMAATDANSAEYKSLSEQRDALVEDFSAASTTFSKNVQTHRKAILNTSSATELKNYLTDKSRVF